jgi:hypothetical protein
VLHVLGLLRPHQSRLIPNQAARELIRLELGDVLKLSGQLPGYEILIVGHSLGEA